MKKFISFLLKIFNFIALVGGVVGFGHLIYSMNIQSDHQLTLQIVDKQEILRKSDDIQKGLLKFNEVPVESLKVTKFKLTNSGDKAFTKDFLVEPLTVSVENSNISFFVTDATFENQDKAKISILFDLLNPDESIEFSVITETTASFKHSFRIREIKELEIDDLILSPPLIERFMNLNFFWYFLLFFSIYRVVDGMNILRGDIKLAPILNLIASIKSASSINSEVFIKDIKELYEAYYLSTRGLYVTPERLEMELKDEAQKLDLNDRKDIVDFYIKAHALVTHHNLYFLRGLSPFVGLAGILISIVAIVLIVTLNL
jgi:hypothetical protein